MRRIAVVATVVVALLGALSPPVSAQAPAPKVTINGLIDTITVGGRNHKDGQYAVANDSQWTARNRGVFGFTGAIGKAKGVLELEIDAGWGQNSQNESASSNAGQTVTPSGAAVGAPQNTFEDCSFDIGGDANGCLELKSLYVEFPVPWVPFPTVMRVGGQYPPIHFKPGVILSESVGGVWFSTTINPWLKFNFTFGQPEEDITGLRGSTNNSRGDDIFIAPTLDIIPIKGVTIRPIYVYYSIQGGSSAFSRCRFNCAGQPSNGSNVSVNQFTGLVSGNASLGNFRTSSTEDRHYFAIDSRMNFGPFFFDPTLIYLTGTVDVYRTSGGTTALSAGLTQGSGDRVIQDRESWYIDLRGGWRGGPLFIQGIFAWAPGDDAQHDSFKSTRNFKGIMHTINQAGLANVFGSTGAVDYFTGSASGIDENYGIGRYGFIRAGATTSYALTPAFSLNGWWSSWWSDTKVDTDAVGTETSPSYGQVPCAAPGGQAASANCTILTSDKRGDSRYIGTEFSLGATYRFAPGLSFDIAGGWFFSGPALDSTFTDRNGVVKHAESKDAQLATARVRYQF